VSLVHAPCGTELEQAFWCRTCATTFGPTAIRGVDRRVPDGTSEALGDATEDAPTPEAGH